MIAPLSPFPANYLFSRFHPPSRHPTIYPPIFADIYQYLPHQLSTASVIIPLARFPCTTLPTRLYKYCLYRASLLVFNVPRACKSIILIVFISSQALEMPITND